MIVVNIFYENKDDLEKAFKALQSHNNYILCVKGDLIYGFSVYDAEDNTLNFKNDKTFKIVDNHISLDLEYICIQYSVDGACMVYHPDC